MIVNSAIELYTTLLGWHLYNSFWTLLASSGIIAIPFIATILTIYLELREQNADFTAKDLLSALETKLYMMLVVVFLCVQPAIDLRTSTVEIAGSSCTATGQQRTRETAAVGDTGTTYDSTASIQSSFGGRVAQMPVWWYFWSKIGYAATFAMKNELPCDADVRSVLANVSTMQITDPQLKSETQQFYEDCYKPAANKFLREEVQPEDVPNAYRTNLSADVSWLGSRMFINTPGFYDQLRPSKPIKAMPYSAARGDDVKGPDLEGTTLTPGPGWPTCDKWWTDSQEGLRNRLLGDLKTKGMSPEQQDAWASASAPLVDSNAQADEALLQTVIASPAQNGSMQMASTPVAQSPLDQLITGTSDTLVSIGVGIDSALMFTRIAALRSGLPIILAIVIMLLIVLSPVIMVIARFDLGVMMGLTLSYLSLVFCSFIFELARWLDNYLLGAAMNKSLPDGALNAFSHMLNSGIATSMKEVVVINWITMAVYLALPIIFLGMMTLSGVRLAGAIGSEMRSLGTGLGNASNTKPPLMKR
jgi:hypothetical protein